MMNSRRIKKPDFICIVFVGYLCGGGPVKNLEKNFQKILNRILVCTVQSDLRYSSLEDLRKNKRNFIKMKKEFIFYSSDIEDVKAFQSFIFSCYSDKIKKSDLKIRDKLLKIVFENNTILTLDFCLSSPVLFVKRGCLSVSFGNIEKVSFFFGNIHVYFKENPDKSRTTINLGYAQ